MMRFGYGGKKEEQIAQLAAKVRAGLGTRSVVLVGMRLSALGPLSRLTKICRNLWLNQP